MSLHHIMTTEWVSEACRVLTAGYVIAVPTDTVYGLAALVQNTTAINSMYHIKGRDRNKPIAICLSQVEDIEKWAKVEDLPPKLLNALLPGKVQQPVALTSANTSNEASCLRVEEFKHLWPLIGAVFCDDSNVDREELRAGSTIIDLSVRGKYSVIRQGVCLAAVKEKLNMFELRECSGDVS